MEDTKKRGFFVSLKNFLGRNMIFIYISLKTFVLELKNIFSGAPGQKAQVFFKGLSTQKSKGLSSQKSKGLSSQNSFAFQRTSQQGILDVLNDIRSKNCAFFKELRSQKSQVFKRTLESKIVDILRIVGFLKVINRRFF